MKYKVNNKLYTIKRLVLSKYSIISICTTLLLIIVYYCSVSFFSFTLESQYFFFSTNSQVTASLFGLTLTAFAFVNSRLKKAKENDSLVDAIDEIRKNYFYDLSAISLVVLISVILNNVSILKSESIILISFFQLLKVISFSLFISSIVIIIIFGVGLFNPNLVRNMIQLQMNDAEIALNKPKNTIQQKYTIEDFIKAYNKFIANIDLALKEIFIKNENNSFFNENNNDVFQQTICDKIALLSTYDSRFENYKNDFMEIRKYRNGILHGFGVSKHDNRVSTDAYNKLEMLNKVLEHDLKILKITKQ